MTHPAPRGARAASAFLLGALAIAIPFAAGKIAASLLAFVALAFGAVHLALAFRDVRAGGRQSDLFEGGLSLLLGFLVLLAPGLATGALALLLGISFAAAGVGKVLTGWPRRGEAGWGALLLDGLFDVAIGAAVALQWPLAGLTSIGLALGFYMFSVGSAALTAKLDRPVSRWTRPVWWWVKYLNGWPSTPEFLSGAFDFNRAPFFQSFVEVRVERSAHRVRILPHASHGRLTWSDLQLIGAVLPPGATESDQVVFSFPLRPE